MDNLSLFTLILACATVLLAGASFWTIRQNYKFREKDRKERLLNEIIEWAENIGKCGFKTNYNLIDARSIEQAHLYMIADIQDDIFSFQSMQVRTVYIKKLSSIFREEIANSVNILVDELNTHIELLNKLENASNHLLEIINHDNIQEKPSAELQKEESLKAASDHRIVLNRSVKKVIEEATKIKTKEIS